MKRVWMEPIDMQDGDEHVETYPCRGLKLIGIRFYPYVGDDKEEERTARCIQKSSTRDSISRKRMEQ